MEDRDEADVIALNAANVALLAPLGAPRLAWLRSLADRCAVVDGDGVGLEVTAVPPNEPSLAFHAARGYLEVGRLGDDTYAVSLMEKPL